MSSSQQFSETYGDVTQSMSMIEPFAGSHMMGSFALLRVCQWNRSSEAMFTLSDSCVKMAAICKTISHIIAARLQTLSGVSRSELPLVSASERMGMLHDAHCVNKDTMTAYFKMMLCHWLHLREQINFERHGSALFQHLHLPVRMRAIMHQCYSLHLSH